MLFSSDLSREKLGGVVESLLQNTSQAIAVVDREMRYLAYSASWVEAYRLQGVELFGRSHYEIFPEIGDEWKATHRECLGGATRSRDNDPFTRQGGGVDYVSWRCGPWHEANGEIGGLLMLTSVSQRDPAIEQELAAHEKRYRDAIETTGDGFWLVDDSGTLIDVNEAYARLSGYSRKELIGMRIPELEAAENPEETAAHMETIIRTGYDIFETRHRRKDGTLWDVEISTSFSNGVFSAFARDITERKELLQQLKLIGEVFENTGEGIMITDPDGTIVDVNAAYCKIMGYRREQVIGENPKLLSSGRHDKKFYENMWRSIKEEGHWIGEVWDRRSSGELFPKWLNINTVYDETGTITHYVGTFSDISALKDVEEQLQRLAYYDALTGLPNRILFQDRMQQEITVCNRHALKFAVMFLDLDRFKNVNDTLGHSAGDELLIEVAHRITASLRENDTVARLGGDEFTIIMRETDKVDAVAQIANKVIDALSRPFNLMGHEVHLGASIGIALFPADGASVDELTKHADSAMYEAKKAGRGQYHFFNHNMDEDAHRHMRLANDLHKAVEQNQLFVMYQIQVDATNGETLGAEALLRWQHPEYGLVSPEVFIPLAEENGLIIPIGEWVMREVCHRISRWHQQGIAPKTVSVNLSARQFRQHDLVERIFAITEEYCLLPQRLEIEVTESVAMEDAEVASQRLHALSERGFSIAIDDFGTGYSSLSYLKRFPADRIKLDRSFVGEIPQDSDSMAVASAVIKLASSLGYEVIAEGVENEAQREFLLNEGCNMMQGYLFGRPLVAEEFEAYMRSTAEASLEVSE